MATNTEGFYLFTHTVGVLVVFWVVLGCFGGVLGVFWGVSGVSAFRVLFLLFLFLETSLSVRFLQRRPCLVRINGGENGGRQSFVQVLYLESTSETWRPIYGVSLTPSAPDS